MTPIAQLRHLVRDIDDLERDRNNWKMLAEFSTAIVARYCEANDLKCLAAPKDDRMEELHKLAGDGRLQLMFGFHDLTPVISDPDTGDVELQSNP